MTNVFIYGGLGILLIGAVFGLFVAIKGYKEQNRNGKNHAFLSGVFMRGPMTPEMRKLVSIWGGITIVGFIILVIGISTGLK